MSGRMCPGGCPGVCVQRGGVSRMVVCLGGGVQGAVESRGCGVQWECGYHPTPLDTPSLHTQPVQTTPPPPNCGQNDRSL